jgi:hypothetical protein
MSLRSSTEYENGELRHAGMDSRHPGAQDASGDIHVALDSSTPCRNDEIESRTETDPGPPPFVFSIWTIAVPRTLGSELNPDHRSAPDW